MADETFAMQYKDDIQERMVTELKKVNDKATIEGSFGRDLINANSVEFENAYAEMNLVVQAAYATTAWGKYLTMIASEFGIDRKTATHSIGEVTITGTANTVVPKGSIFSTADGSIVFTTDEAVTLDTQGKATVAVTSQGTGTAVNVNAGTINHLPSSIYGVTRVNNADATHGGTDDEADDVLRERLLEYVRNPATSGNIYHYKNWALSINEVGYVKVTPLFKGNGTVRVLILGRDKKPCSSETITEVLKYINSVAPIGATVYVDTPTYLTVNIAAMVYLASTSDGYKTEIENKINDYFTELWFNEGSAVSIAQIGRLILDTDLIDDYDSLKLNDGTSNVALAVDQLPKIGTLTLTVGTKG